MLLLNSLLKAMSLSYVHLLYIHFAANSLGFLFLLKVLQFVKFPSRTHVEYPQHKIVLIAIFGRTAESSAA